MIITVKSTHTANWYWIKIPPQLLLWNCPHQIPTGLKSLLSFYCKTTLRFMQFGAVFTLWLTLLFSCRWFYGCSGWSGWWRRCGEGGRRRLGSGGGPGPAPRTGTLLTLFILALLLKTAPYYWYIIGKMFIIPMIKVRNQQGDSMRLKLNRNPVWRVQSIVKEPIFETLWSKKKEVLHHPVDFRGNTIRVHLCTKIMLVWFKASGGVRKPCMYFFGFINNFIYI